MFKQGLTMNERGAEKKVEQGKKGLRVKIMKIIKKKSHCDKKKVKELWFLFCKELLWV